MTKEHLDVCLAYLLHYRAQNAFISEVLQQNSISLPEINHENLCTHDPPSYQHLKESPVENAGFDSHFADGRNVGFLVDSLDLIEYLGR